MVDKQSVKYCTYVRYKGCLGWILGYFLVGISEEKRTSGYDYIDSFKSIKILLIEMKAPLPQSFYFVPKEAKILSCQSISVYKI
jgi:hypothetical protein